MGHLFPRRLCKVWEKGECSEIEIERISYGNCMAKDKLNDIKLILCSILGLSLVSRYSEHYSETFLRIIFVAVFLNCFPA